ncbi:adenine deaminase C-terminal domain-containing protein, partial [Sporosarcina sp. NCCP-2222]|uniref:adenine deaminase C-terminal domain-containing protein n=1 Tax=Sporosarcina sp. NCCP-2222 TaxID=2935073 RepID=UPI0020C09D2E
HVDGVMDKCIQVALDAGVLPVDAYLMASYNVARYYGIDDIQGVIATGRYATLNFLEEETKPVPTDVLSKGVWLLRDNQPVCSFNKVDWSIIPEFHPSFDLTEGDFAEFPQVGIEMVNDVITKPYESNLEVTADVLASGNDESFLMLVDRQGKWRVNTLIKGFATGVQGMASSYSNTGDIILIGKDKQAMLRAFMEMKKMGGGMVLIEDGQVAASIPLPIGGGLSAEDVDVLISQEKELKEALAERGYCFGDAVYTFLFLQSTHLPYVRVTQNGLFNVLKNKVIFPATGR